MVVFLDFTQLKVKYLDETYDTVVEDGRSNVPVIDNRRISISMKSYWFSWISPNSKSNIWMKRMTRW